MQFSWKISAATAFCTNNCVSAKYIFVHCLKDIHKQFVVVNFEMLLHLL